jgi:hypothetical protein
VYTLAPTAASDLFLVVLVENRVVGGRSDTFGPSDAAGVIVTVRSDGIAPGTLE